MLQISQQLSLKNILFSIFPGRKIETDFNVIVGQKVTMNPRRNLLNSISLVVK